jgi:hypothetical protein
MVDGRNVTWHDPITVLLNRRTKKPPQSAVSMFVSGEKKEKKVKKNEKIRASSL